MVILEKFNKKAIYSYCYGCNKNEHLIKKLENNQELVYSHDYNLEIVSVELIDYAEKKVFNIAFLGNYDEINHFIGDYGIHTTIEEISEILEVFFDITDVGMSTSFEQIYKNWY